jgi:hypothetical protein
MDSINLMITPRRLQALLRVAGTAQECGDRRDELRCAMNLRALRYLIALADCLNFSRAADRCAVTQSTLSIQLRKLEEYLGVRLFDRDRAHVRLTVEGAEVLRLARVAVGAEVEILRICRNRVAPRLSDTEERRDESPPRSY